MQLGWIKRLFGNETAEADDPGEFQAERLVVVNASQPKRSRLPSFRKAASVRARPQDDRLEILRGRVRSAFSPSRPVVDSDLYSGRSRLLRSLISAVEDGNMHVIIFGTRGIGKTSTLHVLNAMARDAHYIVHYGSCGQNVTFAELFGAVLADIPLLFHRDYDPVAPEIEEGLTFADLYEGEAVTVSMLSEAFTKISGTQLLIILDEFDRIEVSGVRRLVAELIKNLSDRAAPVQLVIAGVAQNIDEIVEHIPSIRRNILAIRMPNMDREETQELIERGAERSGLRFTEEASARINEVALGLPYIASLLAHHSALLAIESGREAIEVAEVDAAALQAMEESELRLNPSLLRATRSAIEAGLQPVLAILARQALQSGGSFTLPKEIDPAAIERLVSEFRLLGRTDGDMGDSVAFVEDGVPVYIWILAAAEKPSSPADKATPFKIVRGPDLS